MNFARIHQGPLDDHPELARGLPVLNLASCFAFIPLAPSIGLASVDINEYLPAVTAEKVKATIQWVISKG
jgi:hypothetical protein